jgi:hypothetical protein
MSDAAPTFEPDFTCVGTCGGASSQEKRGLRSAVIGALALIALVLSAAPWVAASPQTDAKAEEVLSAARIALGGDGALTKIQSVTVTGATRRMMGDREFSSDVTLDLLLPDKFKRTEEMSFGQGGPSVTRVSAANGAEVWDDGTNRGGGGFMRFAPGGPGAGGPPGATGAAGATGARREPTEEERQRFRQMQEQRIKSERARYALIWFLRSDAPVTYAGVAEAPDGKADVLEVKPEGAAPMKLFIDQESHKPLMLTYEGVLPRMMVRGQRPTPEELEKMRSEPPQKATFEVHFSDYKEVDGVLLPHLISQSVNSKVTEEFTIEKYKLNAPLKAADFVKKGS